MGVAGLRPVDELQDELTGSQRIWRWWLRGYIVFPQEGQDANGL
jgi:hypothetical protein